VLLSKQGTLISLFGDHTLIVISKRVPRRARRARLRVTDPLFRARPSAPVLLEVVPQPRLGGALGRGPAAARHRRRRRAQRAGTRDDSPDRRADSPGPRRSRLEGSPNGRGPPVRSGTCRGRQSTLRPESRERRSPRERLLAATRSLSHIHGSPSHADDAKARDRVGRSWRQCYIPCSAESIRGSVRV